MRIFEVCADSGIPFDGTKGASVHVRALADALQRWGQDLHVFMANPGESHADRSVDVRPLEPGSLDEAAARLGPPDLVYERYALGHESGLEFARRVGSPFMLEVNSPLVLEASRHRPRKLGARDAEIERRLFRQADVVSAVSEPLRSYVAGIRGTDRGTLVVRNGCDAATIGPPASLDGGPPHTLVFLGHPKPWHGAHELPPMLAELVRRRHDVRLLLIGGGPGADLVLDRGVQNGVADRIDVTGPVPSEKVPRLLREGTVAVAPYPPDPFFYFCPLKVMEFMAAGLPVVTTAQGDLPDILGDAGILVPPGDLWAMVDGLERLLADEALRRRLARQARERVLSRFTWDAAVEAVMEAVSKTNEVRQWVA